MAILVDKFSPGLILANPVVAVVNVDSLLKIPTSVLSIKNFKTTYVALGLSETMVSGMAPVLPAELEAAGPTKVQLVPL